MSLSIKIWKPIVFKIAQILYSKVLRKMIYEKIEDSDSKWDDRAMDALDSIFK